MGAEPRLGRMSRPRKQEGVIAQRADETLVLLSLTSGQYYALDEVGVRVWELCDGARSVAEVVSLLTQEYDAPAETIETDVLELLEDLASERLVVES
jgi:pyrroloquinoline quinone biosynthesis protein D